MRTDSICSLTAALVAALDRCRQGGGTLVDYVSGHPINGQLGTLSNAYTDRPILTDSAEEFVQFLAVDSNRLNHKRRILLVIGALCYYLLPAHLRQQWSIFNEDSPDAPVVKGKTVQYMACVFQSRPRRRVDSLSQPLHGSL
jgi:hypothetical protein